MSANFGPVFYADISHTNTFLQWLLSFAITRSGNKEAHPSP